MRIISGIARSRAIKVPKSVVRPTTDRTREALFNMISSRVADAKVLDLFAGSGAMGMEALSRGAKEAVFVDANRICAAGVEENLKSLRLQGGTVILSDALIYLKQRMRGSVDLIFADPPYYKQAGDEDFIKTMLEWGGLGACLNEGGLCILEMDAGYALGEHAGLELLDRRTYGGCSIAIFEKGKICAD